MAIKIIYETETGKKIRKFFNISVSITAAGCLIYNNDKYENIKKLAVVLGITGGILISDFIIGEKKDIETYKEDEE